MRPAPAPNTIRIPESALGPCAHIASPISHDDPPYRVLLEPGTSNIEDKLERFLIGCNNCIRLIPAPISEHCLRLFPAIGAGDRTAFEELAHEVAAYCRQFSPRWQPRLVYHPPAPPLHDPRRPRLPHHSWLMPHASLPVPAVVDWHIPPAPYLTEDDPSQFHQFLRANTRYLRSTPAQTIDWDNLDPTHARFLEAQGHRELAHSPRKVSLGYANTYLGPFPVMRWIRADKPQRQAKRIVRPHFLQRCAWPERLPIFPPHLSEIRALATDVKTINTFLPRCLASYYVAPTVLRNVPTTAEQWAQSPFATQIHPLDYIEPNLRAQVAILHSYMQRCMGAQACLVIEDQCVEMLRPGTPAAALPKLRWDAYCLLAETRRLRRVAKIFRAHMVEAHKTEDTYEEMVKHLPSMIHAAYGQARRVHKLHHEGARMGVIAAATGLPNTSVREVLLGHLAPGTHPYINAAKVRHTKEQS